MSWRTNLARPLKPVDQPALETLSDARAYMLALPDGVANQRAWQYAAELPLEAAKRDDPLAIRQATDQVERALFFTYRLDLSGGSAAKARRSSAKSAEPTLARSKSAKVSSR